PPESAARRSSRRHRSELPTSPVHYRHLILRSSPGTLRTPRTLASAGTQCRQARYSRHAWTRRAGIMQFCPTCQPDSVLPWAATVVFRFLAEATVLFHVAFVLFVALGGLFVARWRWLAWIHLPAAAWGAWVEFARWVCPLTPLENWLRVQGGAAAYS